MVPWNRPPAVVDGISACAHHSILGHERAISFAHRGPGHVAVPLRTRTSAVSLCSVWVRDTEAVGVREFNTETRQQTLRRIR